MVRGEARAIDEEIRAGAERLGQLGRIVAVRRDEASGDARRNVRRIAPCEVDLPTGGQ